MEFPSKLIAEIEKRNIKPAQVTEQLLAFIKGTPKISIDRPASKYDGILSIDGLERSHYTNLYNTSQHQLTIYKFTPASGMATRMFKSLLEFYNQKIINTGTKYFFNNLHKFPFYKDVIIEFHKKHPLIKKLDTLANRLTFIDFLLNENCLNFKNKPKGLIKFHQYDIDNKTAIEEQIDESIHYCIGNNNVINLHFTVNPNFLEDFKKHINEYITNNYLNHPFTFNIEFSVQKNNTDTIAVNFDNTPYIDENGDYVFRAGGHGALIDNLNNLDADLIFIKNIDNVCHQNHIEETIKYKQILAGKLISVKKSVTNFLHEIDNNNADINAITLFLKENFNINLSKENTNKDYLHQLLNRPIRICGMIENQGDIGGGPFWIRNKQGEKEIQILEAIQIDKNNPEQQNILEKATHFNPVDIICATKDYKGNNFNLHEYVDNDAYFVTEKTFNGTIVKGLELPGLWNGGMANWLSIYVEVPIDTFNPVKTITDLLSPMHQA